MALGGWLGGFLFDVSGNCTGSIAAAILTTCVGIPLALALPRHQRPPSAGPRAVREASARLELPGDREVGRWTETPSSPSRSYALPP